MKKHNFFAFSFFYRNRNYLINFIYRYIYSLEINNNKMSSHCYVTNFVLTNYHAYYKAPLQTFHQNANVTSPSDELLRHVAFYVTVCTPVAFAVLTCYLVYFLHDLLFTPINRVRLLEENGFVFIYLNYLLN